MTEAKRLKVEVPGFSLAFNDPATGRACCRAGNVGSLCAACRAQVSADNGVPASVVAAHASQRQGIRSYDVALAARRPVSQAKSDRPGELRPYTVALQRERERQAVAR